MPEFLKAQYYSTSSSETFFFLFQIHILAIILMTTLLYAYGFNLEEIRKILRFHFHLVLKSFEENYMVLNADKCYFIYLGKDSENEPFILNNFIFNNSNEEMLGINIDNKATFKSHFKALCKKFTQKIVALSRLLNHLNDSRKRLVFNSTIKSQFNHRCFVLKHQIM